MNEKNVKFKVNGMHCEGCANKIKTGLVAIDNECKTEIEVASGKVLVSFNSSKTNVAEIKNKITSIGFQVESVELE